MSQSAETIAAFTAAYHKVYGQKPVVDAKGGWYKVNGEKSVRLKELAKMAEELLQQSPQKSKRATSTAQKQKKCCFYVKRALSL